MPKSNKVYQGLLPVEHKCNFCEKVFSYYSKMKEHEIVHSNERPFKCDFCEKLFKRKETCSSHMERVHSQHMMKCKLEPNLETPVTAPKKKEKNPRVYDCGICGKLFPCPSNLKIHTRMHTGERPFKCSYCPKDYRHKQDLNLHVKSVHPESIEESLNLPVAEIKFEPDCDFSVDNIESLKESVKKEIIEDLNEFHVTNSPSNETPQNAAVYSHTDKSKTLPTSLKRKCFNPGEIH